VTLAHWTVATKEIMKNEHGKKSWQVRTKKLFENHNKMRFFSAYNVFKV
jgi:hypothetical protein